MNVCPQGVESHGGKIRDGWKDDGWMDEADGQMDDLMVNDGWRDEDDDG